MIPLSFMKKSEFTYSLNDQTITADMTIVHFDMEDENDKNDNYLILFKPFIVMAYKNQVTMITSVSINLATNETKWTEQKTGKKLLANEVDPKLEKRIIAELLLG